jgi:aspartate kinase
MEVLVKHGVSYISKATNANTIDLIVWDRDIDDSLTGELRAMFDSVETRPVAIVCAIGSNIAKPGILSRAAGALAEAGVNIISLAQTARQTNMQFTVGREDFVKAQRALHARLCEA